jgi:hypothetical protein
MTGENAVSVVLPAERFTNVARLVVTGFVSQLPVGFESVDDFELAIELILRSVPVAGTRTTVALARDAEELRVALGPFDVQAAQRQLRETVHEGMNLETFLGRLVDSVELVEGPAPTLVLRKELNC